MALSLYLLGERSTSQPLSLIPPTESSSQAPVAAAPGGTSPASLTYDYQVVKVSDGDTITVSHLGQQERVRFACMDAPEKSQPLGMDARSQLESLINQAGGKVALDVVDVDRYNRKVAEVWVNLNGQPVLAQQWMLARGYSMVYHRYLANCRSRDVAIAAESQAKSSRLGVWGVPGFTPPWEYRKQQRDSHS